MKKTEIAKLFAMINSAYPNFDVSPEKIAMWERFMGDYPFEQAQKNLLDHIQRNPFIPTVAEIKKVPNAGESSFDHAKLKSETKERLALIDAWSKQSVPRPSLMSGGEETNGH